MPINFLVSSFLFFGLPALYLSARNKTSIPRAALFAAIFVIFGGGIVDYFSTYNNAWFVPTVLPFKLFGKVALEDLFWGFLFTYTIIMFYENFFDHRVHKTLGKKMPYFAAFLVICFLILALSLQLLKSLPVIHYFYLKGGLVLVLLPLVAFLVRFPRFISSFLKTLPYFFSLALLNEIAALHKGYWFFPTHEFIGWVSLGSSRFPFEEFLFFIIILSSSTLAYFEFFDDNRVHLNFGTVRVKS